MSQPQNLSTSTPWPEAAIPREWVESLFKKMAFTYGARFTDQWRGIDTTEIKRHWATELGVLSNAELVRGVQQLPECHWPPTLPEFVKLCRPAVDPVVAYHEALEQGSRRERAESDVWSTPAIFWAWRKIGARDFAHLAYSVLRPRWEAALAAELAKAPLIPVPAQAVALVAPGKLLTSVDRAHELLGQFKRDGIKPAADVAGDGKQWARRILERRDRGEVMFYMQVESAEKVLGLR